MKRHGGIYEKFCSWENIWLAYQKAKKGARVNQENAAFFFHLERELFQLQAEFLNLTYQPRPYRYFQIFDPKVRTISVAPFRDRVAHHALVNVLEPIYEKIFIFDSYATRKGKGHHAAIFRAQEYLKQNTWFFKSDIEKFFDSISHEKMLFILRKKIKDPPLLELAEKIIRNGGQDGVGLPIGNLTSQFFANVFLNELDYFVKQELKMRSYIRYMDDFVLFHPDKDVLKNARRRIEDYLAKELFLSLKPQNTYFNQGLNGLTFLGKRIFPEHIRIATPNLRRFSSRLEALEKGWQAGIIPEEKFLQQANSYWAIFSHYPTWKLRQKMILDKGRPT